MWIGIEKAICCQIFGACIALCISTTYANEGSKYTSEYAWRNVKEVSQRLVPVWNNQIKSAVKFTNKQGYNIDELGLEVSQNCNWEPSYDPAKEPPRVEYGLPLLLLSQHLQQAYLLYLFDETLLLDPQDVDDYAQKVLAPILRFEQKQCSDTIEGDKTRITSNIPTILAGKFSEAKYKKKLQVLESRPEVVLNSDFIAGFPIFFALLHEAGHFALHTNKTAQSLNTELEADTFAVEIFKKNEVSPTLGIGHIVLFYFNKNQSSDLGCRITRIAHADNVGFETFQHRLGHYARGQYQRLRSHYRTKYANAC